MKTISKLHCRYEMVLIYQPPNAHVRNSRILLSNAMAAAAVKKIYRPMECPNNMVGNRPHLLITRSFKQFNTLA
jgi:hypothetical protein